jgi:hypothetical protein
MRELLVTGLLKVVREMQGMRLTAAILPLAPDENKTPFLKPILFETDLIDEEFLCCAAVSKDGTVYLRV